MKALKKVIAVSFAAAAILGIAASASAKMPTAPGTVTVMLYKEKASCPDNRWVADTATTVIPFKNLRWDAKIFDISVNNSKTSVECRATGAYELNICKGTYAKPGDQSVVKFYVKQKEAGEYEYKKFKVTVKYMAAIVPVTEFSIEGVDALNDLHKIDFVSSFANSGKPVKNIDYTLKGGMANCVVNVAFNTKYYAADKLYATLKSSGKEIRIFNGNMYDLTKFSCIKATYNTTATLWKAYSQEFNGGWKYYKVPNDSFKGTKRFSNGKALVVNLK